MLRGHTHPETNQGVKSRGQTRNRADMKQVTHTKWLFPASMRCLHALRWTDGWMDSRGQQSFNIKDCMLDTTRTNSPGLVDIVILNYVLTFVCIYFAKYVIFLVSTWPQALCNSSDFSWRMFFYLFIFFPDLHPHCDLRSSASHLLRGQTVPSAWTLIWGFPWCVENMTRRTQADVARCY